MLVPASYVSYGQRMIDILHNDGFPAPIIVFVNQKKTADMVCKDIQRAGVRFHYFLRVYVIFS